MPVLLLPLLRVEVDVGAIGPEPRRQLLARDHLTRAAEQQLQHLEALIGETNFQAALPKFAGLAVEFEDPKSDDAIGRSRRLHLLSLSRTA